jgi:predicted nucleotidyltransferase component of viral defense system
MAFADTYRRQVALLLRVLPIVAVEDCFALKGGTAINLFMRDMPRLSVDIDLTYLPTHPRPEALAAIDAALRRIAEHVRAIIPGSCVTETVLQPEGALTKLLVRADGVQIKIEVTPVLRGTVYPPEMRAVSPSVEAEFGFAEIAVVSFADLYAGKLVAALDRQHPRDFFDVRDLLANEGIDDALRRAFIVYLLSHHRPMAEVLASRPKPIGTEYLRGFAGMTAEPVAEAELLTARDRLIETIVGEMPKAHRRFLVSFERGEPEWNLLGVPGVADLPAVLWRQHNLDMLSATRRAGLVTQLESVLSGENAR